MISEFNGKPVNRSRISQDKRKQIVIDYLDGRTMQEVAALHGVGHSTVGKIVKEADAYRRGSMLDEHKVEIEQLAKKGTERAKIANKFGCSVHCVYLFCQKHKIPLVNSRAKYNKQKNELDEDFDLISQIAKEFTAAELAEKWDVKLEVMQNWLSTRKVKAKKPLTSSGEGFTGE